MSKSEKINWRLTLKVRQAVIEDRVLVSTHFIESMKKIHLANEELPGVLLGGVVLSKRERDELRTAIDGYKHFMRSITPARIVCEIVFKFIMSQPGREELVVLITTYKGKI